MQAVDPKNPMKNAICSILFLCLFTGGLSLPAGRAEEKPWTEQFLSQFEEIKARLANIEKQQQDIAAKEAVILEKLDQLRVWVHRK